MTDIWLIKDTKGHILPAYEADKEALNAMPTMQAFKASTAKYRDRTHHNRMMSLFRFYWDSFEPPEAEYHGVKVSMSYDRFRADVMRTMGYFTPVVNIKGEVRAEPDSLAFDKCSEEKARRIYEDLLNFGAKRIFSGNMSPEKVQKLSEEWLRYN